MNYLTTIRALVRTYQAFESYSSRHVRALGLTPVQFDVIASLANQPPMTYKQLGESTLISKSSLTGVIERMVQKDLICVVKNTEDARSQNLALTAQGQRIFETVFPAHLAHVETAFNQLSAAQLKDIEASLSTLKSIFNHERT